MLLLIHGNDLYNNSLYLKNITSNFQKKYTEVSIQNYDLEEVNSITDINLGNDYGFFVSNSLVIFQNTQSSDKGISSKVILHILNNPDDNFILFERQEIKSDSDLIKKITENKGKIVLNNLPKWENQKFENTIKFVQERLKSIGISMEMREIYKLSNFLGNDYFHISNELNKLPYLISDDKLPDNYIDYLVGGKEYIVFDYVNFIFQDSFDLKKFVELTRTILSNQTNFPLITSLINRELRIRYIKFAEKNLQLLYNLLLDIDLEFKSGADPINLLIKFYIGVHCPKL